MIPYLKKVKNLLKKSQGKDFQSLPCSPYKLSQTNRFYTTTNIAIPLVKDSLPGLVSSLTSNAINKFERKISEKVAVRAGKAFTLFISNEGMNDIMKIIKPLKIQVY